MNLKTAKEHKKIWNNKPILKVIYQEWYKKISYGLKDKPKGISIEIGSGCANISQYNPKTLTSDIQIENWLDIVNDAQYLPYKNNTISSISLIDAFHHIPDPIKFLNESYRVLKAGGRIAIIEPYPTFLSSFFYTYFHNEPLIKHQSLLNDKTSYFCPNQAASFILFKKEINLFKEKYKGKFSIEIKNLFSTILYPLSGGYKNFSLVPKFLIKPFQVFEKIISPLNKFLAFRIFIVIKKVPNDKKYNK